MTAFILGLTNLMRNQEAEVHACTHSLRGEGMWTKWSGPEAHATHMGSNGS